MPDANYSPSKLNDLIAEQEAIAESSSSNNRFSVYEDIGGPSQILDDELLARQTQEQWHLEEQREQQL